MAGKASVVALFLAVNLAVFAMASASGGDCPTPPTPSTPTPTPASSGKCPRDALKLGVCANVLGLIKAKVGVSPTEPCCPLLEGLVDLEAALCLCTAIKGNILGIKLNLTVDLSLILNHCGKSVPTGFNALQGRGLQLEPWHPRPSSSWLSTSCSSQWPTPAEAARPQRRHRRRLLLPHPSIRGKCPLNALKFGVCADVLGLVKGEAGKVPAEPCCTLIKGLVDLEAAVCLCTAIKANVLGVVIDVPIKLSALVNYCGKCVPKGYICA
ncbi:unnamed protein product [Miscanthus lutarioriparius]|uniref:Bifunctional inhibitor/plant lipid transfer protein/seed storage helical domain-containing protein n=1 Tax=Miscanthus lutarioriparius TaxID=422564 RepID=A0A811R0Y8_9POAL|nr:unnamed protein product [Miscanthus lutarioriparius]